MKFIHIADVHLGAEPDAGRAYSEGRLQELWDTFSNVIELCEREQIDLLLIAGDLFHRQPLLRELKEVNSLFSTLSVTQVILIAGNHDYVKRDSYYRTFQWNHNVHPLIGADMGYTKLESLELAVYGFSYHEKELRRMFEPFHAPGRMPYEILLLHGGDEKHLSFRRETLESAGFDYIALGHIHKPQALIKNRAVYSGALEPVDKNDTGQHGFVRGEITTNGTRVEFVPFAKREYMHLALRVQETMTNNSLKNYIKETIEKRGTDHLYKLVLRGLRDPDVVFDTTYMDCYGNILEILDETQMAYNYEELYEKNKENLIGKYIEEFQDCEEGSIEYQALQEGIQALLDNSSI